MTEKNDPSCHFSISWPASCIMDEEALPPRRRFARTTASAASSTVILSLLTIYFLAAVHYLSSPNNYTADPTPLHRRVLFLHRRVLFFSSLRDNDYKTVTPRIGHPLKEEAVVTDDNEQQQQQQQQQHQQHYELLASPLFIVPETQLVSTKYEVPTITRTRVIPQVGSHAIVDVLSIGSNARPEYVSVLCVFPACLLAILHLLIYMDFFVVVVVVIVIFRFSLPHNETRGQITIAYVTFGA